MRLLSQATSSHVASMRVNAIAEMRSRMEVVRPPTGSRGVVWLATETQLYVIDRSIAVHCLYQLLLTGVGDLRWSQSVERV